MKKLIAMLLVLAMAACLFGCANTDSGKTTTAATAEATTEATDNGVMSYAEYAAAELDSEVTVSFTVQATQSWWDDQIVVYGQDKDGGYLVYNMVCTKEDAAKLVGSVIKVTGYKAEFEGEIELAEGATFEFVEGAEPFTAEAVDLTDKMASDDLINYQNQKAAFKGLTVKAISFKNDGGDDIYLTLTKDDQDYNFCVERYLTDPETEVYKTAAALQAGDVIDVEGFVYWYQGMNPHITAIAVAE